MGHLRTVDGRAWARSRPVAPAEPEREASADGGAPGGL